MVTLSHNSLHGLQGAEYPVVATRQPLLAFLIPLTPHFRSERLTHELVSSMNRLSCYKSQVEPKLMRIVTLMYLFALLALCMAPSFVFGGNLYFSPSGTSMWDGGCANISSCTSAQPCQLQSGGMSITTYDLPSCTIFLFSGDYGSNLIEISSTEAPLELRGMEDGVVNLHIDLSTEASLSVRNLQLSTTYAIFTATGSASNETEMVVEDSIFSLSAGSDPSASAIEFSRNPSEYLLTTIRNVIFSSSSADVQSIVRAGSQNLTFQDVTFIGDSKAIIGNCRSLIFDRVTSNTPSIFQGDAEEVQILDSKLLQISRSAFVGTTAMTRLVIERSNFTGAARFLEPDQLLSDPQLNALSHILVSNVVSGTSFTFGALYATGIVSVTDSKFSDGFGTVDLHGATVVTANGNSFNRSYDSPLLGFNVHQGEPTIEIRANSFSQNPSKAHWNTAMLTLSNVSLIDSDTDVSVDSLAVGSFVRLNGLWRVTHDIMSLGGSNDTLFGQDWELAVTLGSVDISNVSVLFLSDLLTYEVTNANKGIVGPNMTFGHIVRLSHLPTVVWNEKNLGGMLPTLNQLYPFITSLETLPSEPFRLSSRFNYSLISGSLANEAKLVFNPVPCPNNCNPSHSASECLIIARCLCTGSYGGPLCNCDQTGIPSSAQCSESGSPVWEFESSATVANLIVPASHNVQVHGDLTATGNVELLTGSSLNASGEVEISGNFRISGILTAYEDSECHLNTPNYVHANSLQFTGSPVVTVVLDVSALDSNFSCTSTSGSSNATFRSSTTTSMSASTSWNVIFNNPLGSRRSDLKRDATDGVFNVTTALLKSSNAAGSSNMAVQTSITPPIGSCGSFTQAAGSLYTSVHPCSPVSPPSDGSPSNDSKDSNIKWWYWGIPVIAVGAILIIVLIILLITRPCCKKTKPYRGSI